MSFKAFISSKIFLLNIGAAVLITLMLLMIVLYALRGYTDHGESFAIPDFQNMNMEDVHRLAVQKSLRYEVIDSIYTRDATPGTVIDQFPVPGFSVKKGRKVFLTICARNPERIMMPALTDVSLRQAVSIMQGVGLNVGEVEYVPSEYPSLVLAQKFQGSVIAPGEMVDRGASIDLVVGKSGSGEMTVVPDLAGVTFEQAQNEITVLNLTLGAVIYDESVLNIADSINARVWQQRPEPSGDVVYQGTSVDLWLTVEEDKISRNLKSGAGAEQESEVIEW